MNNSESSYFTRFAKGTSMAAGKPITFIGAASVIVIWGITGPIFHYSDTWQLVINTGTTIITFLMVFLIQNTQNRDSMAVQLKLDELINAIEGARNEMIKAEDLDEADLEIKSEEMTVLANKKDGPSLRGLAAG
jgi:low affinity Fe/Cu permease